LFFDLFLAFLPPWLSSFAFSAVHRSAAAHELRIASIAKLKRTPLTERSERVRISFIENKNSPETMDRGLCGMFVKSGGNGNLN